MKKNLLILICLFCIKTISSQSTVFHWAKQFGGIGIESGTSITTDTQGNVYTTGYFSNTADFDPGAGTFTLTASINNYDVFISKLDASGNFVWAKQVAVYSSSVLTSVSVDGLGNLNIIGTFSGITDFDPGAGTYTLAPSSTGTVFILKLDASGNFVWAKQFTGLASAARGLAITSDALGNVYTTGLFNGVVDFDPGAGTNTLTTSGNYIYTFISKLDASGNFVWAKQMGGNGSFYGNSIVLDAQSNIYLSGSYSGTVDVDPGAGSFSLTSYFSPDVFVSKLDVSGNFVWAKSMGGLNGSEVAYAMAVDLSGNVYTTGNFAATADFDPGAGVFNLISEGGKDIFISKLDAGGNFVWAKQIGGLTDDYGRGIALDALNNVYTTGSFKGAADFDPALPINYLTSGGFDAVFISKLDVNGNYVWAEKIGGTMNATIAYAIALDAMGSIFTTGYFAETVDFDAGAGVFNLASIINGYDIFVGKTGQTSVGVKENFNFNTISIYPNPANEVINVQLDSDVYQKLNGKALNIHLINALGEVVLSSSFNEDKSIIFNIQQFNNGLYFVKIISDNNTMLTKKIVKN